MEVEIVGAAFALPPLAAAPAPAIYPAAAMPEAEARA